MADRLADETLADILAQSLAVRDEDFACTTASKSPFASDALSSSMLLLVCKRWMRVATPLLYESVILRSVPQAMALAAALKANADFGRYIKKVRVEGGVGASICSVFKAAPNITDLALTLDLYSSDNVASMYKSLRESVAPRRLVLCTALWRPNANKSTAIAVETLCKCIVEWPTLRVVTIPEIIAAGYTEISQAILRAPQLHMIHIPKPWSDNCGSGYLSRFAEQCAAPVVRVGWPARGLTSLLGIPEDRLAELSPRAREKVQFEETQTLRQDALPTDPTFTPLRDCSEETRRSILEMILQLVIAHTTGIDEEKLAEYEWFANIDESPLPHGPALQCMLVCKEWKEIATLVACQTVVLSNPANLARFARLLSTDKAAGLQHRVRSLKLCADTYSLPHDLVVKIDAALPEFLEKLDHLEHFDSADVRIPPAAFDVLTSTLSGNLRSLSLLFCTAGTYTLRPFPRLTTLRFQIASRDIKLAVDQAPPAFPALEELALSGSGSGRLLPILTLCDMPALRAFEFDECSWSDFKAFLSAHGKRLQTVKNLGRDDLLSFVIPECVNVTSVDVSYGRIPAPLSWPGPGLGEVFKMMRASGMFPASYRDTWSPPPPPKPALEEIILPALDCLRRGAPPLREDEPEIARLDAFLAQLPADQLPQLRTVRIRQRDIWPTTQRKMAKHPLLPVAEKMLARGLRLVDAEGVGWKPRMSTATQRRKAS